MNHLVSPSSVNFICQLSQQFTLG